MYSRDIRQFRFRLNDKSNRYIYRKEAIVKAMIFRDLKGLKF
jgi:hypothetical protein